MSTELVQLHKMTLVCGRMKSVDFKDSSAAGKSIYSILDERNFRDYEEESANGDGEVRHIHKDKCKTKEKPSMKRGRYQMRFAKRNILIT